jgi:predicted phage terminase large subunit-like protein
LKHTPFLWKIKPAKNFCKIQTKWTFMHAAQIPSEVEAERLKLELRLALLEAQEKGRSSFLGFSRYVWPEAIISSHHIKMAAAFDRIADGTLKRLIINMPPRHTKSEFASYLLPAYTMGREPSTKIIQATHTGELAVRFGRKVRNLMELDTYQQIFEKVKLKADSKAAGRWDTNHGGEYFAVGVGGAMTGRGADLLIIDDPHSEQDALSQLALDNAWEWYTSGPRSRLQPGGAVVIVMTRWGTKDLTARLIKAQTTHNADQWEVIEFPAVFNEDTEEEKALWPSFWKLEELKAVRASLAVQKWNAMYQQRPTSDEGAILKREWWCRWEHEYMPHLEYIIQSYDTAYSKKETADYSVITTWGVFYPDEDAGPNILLVDVRKGRYDFPELKRVAKEQHDYWQPDNVLIEAKATGITLQQELRRMGIPVTMYSPGGRRAGQDKVSRANSVAPIMESGMVWAPETAWADDLIEECAAFPHGDNDDMVDSTTQALMRFRAGNFVSLYSDERDEPHNEDLVPEYY